MTALSDALAQAQRAALAALGKRAVQSHDGLEREQAIRQMDEMGCADRTEQEQLWEAWRTMRVYGAAAPVLEPQSYSARRVQEPATDAQLKLIEKLCNEKQVAYPDVAGLTKETAHVVIDSLKNGSYDPDKWTVPF